jgi:hypothetical protein
MVPATMDSNVSKSAQHSKYASKCVPTYANAVDAAFDWPKTFRHAYANKITIAQQDNFATREPPKISTQVHAPPSKQTNVPPDKYAQPTPPKETIASQNKANAPSANVAPFSNNAKPAYNASNPPITMALSVCNHAREIHAHRDNSAFPGAIKKHTAHAETTRIVPMGFRASC